MNIMGSQNQYTELESQNTKYGSFEESKPLQKNYTTNFPKVKYESLNEIHLDFSKANHFKKNNNRNSINNENENDENIISEPLTTSPKYSSAISKDNFFEKFPINHKDYLNSIRTNSSNSNSTTNSSTTYVQPILHSNNLNNDNDMDNETIDSNEINNIDIESNIKRKNSPNVIIDTELKNNTNISFSSSANTTFTFPNNNINQFVNTSETPSTEATLDSPFTFKNFEITPITTSNTNLPTPTTPTTPTLETPKTSNTSFATQNLFKSILSPIPKKQTENQNIANLDESFHQKIDTINQNENNEKLFQLKINTNINNDKSQKFLDATSPSSFSSGSRTPTLNFKSFKNFDRLKDQLEKNSKTACFIYIK